MSDTVKVDVLQIDTGKSQQSVAGLRNEIKSLKDQLVGLDEGTKEYNDTLLELGDKMHQLKEINEQVRQTTTDFGDRLSNVRGTITGMTGAFQTVLGSLSLMGVNIGDDVKMLKLLQSAMSITQGVAAIDSGVKAFKALSISIKASTKAMSGLKKALLASGVGALVVAVGLLIANMDKLVSLFTGATDESEKFAKANERLQRSLESLNTQTELEVAMMEQDGATKTAVAQKRLEAARAALAEADATVDLIRAKGELNKAEMEELQKAMDVAKQRADIVTKALQDVFLAERQADIDRRKAAEEAAKKRLEAQRAAAQKEAEQRKADIAKIAQIESEAKYGTMGSEEGELAKLEANYKDQLALYEKYGQDTATLTEYYEKQKAEIIAKYSAERAEAKRAEAEAARDQAELQAETEYQMRRAELIIANEANVDEQLLQLDMDFRDRREELLRQRYEEGLLTTEDFNNQLAQLEVEAANLQIEQEERVTEKTKEQLEKRQKIQEAHAKAMSSIVGSVTSILGTIGSTLEEGSEEWKAVMTAEAIISTIKGGIDAYMGMIQSIPGPAGIAAGALAAAATVAAGMAEIAKIQNTEISTSSSPTSNNGTALASVNQGAVSVLSTQVTNTRSVATEDDIANLPDTRVYVLESDITDSQRRVRTTVENSTY